ncbi:MAG: DUF3786 domain-containing protein [Planctomycetes bacterium]|nr:DUF3786 domain-containing protein [Planctomycetota bacterium]
MIHKELWAMLEKAVPADVCKRSMAAFDAQGCCYVLQSLGDEFRIDPARQKIFKNNGSVPEKDWNIYIAFVQYLLNAKDERPAGEWVNEKQLVAGEFFFRGPHVLPVDSIETAYGSDAECFVKRCEALGGVKMPGMGDAAVKLQVLPRIEVVYILWKADDEFPAQVKVLFDRTADRHLPLDAILSMMNYTQKKFMGS